RGLLVRPSAGRPVGGQCRHARGRGAADRPAKRARRRAHPHRRQPRRAGRAVHRLAPTDAGHPARGDPAMSATAWGIGVGPGDPELLTLKALRLIRAAPVIAYPAPEVGEAFARAIVAPYLTGYQEEIPIRMPLGDGQFPKGEIYDAAAQAIAGHVVEGRD